MSPYMPLADPVPRPVDVAGERRQLTSLAYRLLGSMADAEDVVQETSARWYALSPAQQGSVAAPGAWLTTLASGICLDLLGSARVRREMYAVVVAGVCGGQPPRAPAPTGRRRTPAA